MSTALSGTVTASVNFNYIEPAIFGNATPTINIPLGTTALGIANGTAANQAQKIWPGSLALVVSTPQSIDLTALTWPDGSTITNFTGGGVRGILVVNTSQTPGATVLLKPGTTNGFSGFLSGTTPTISIPAGGSFLLVDPLQTDWTVDATHKSITFDPGTTAQTVNIVIWGV